MNRFLASVTVGVMVPGLTACRGEVSVTPATDEEEVPVDYEQED